MSEPVIDTEKFLVPSVNPEMGNHVFALANIRLAERRIPEIETVNRATAPELLAVMNVAYLNLSTYLATMRAEKIAGKRKLKEIEAVIILDKAAGILEAKGLPQSKDCRDAVVATDPDYREALDHVNMVDSAILWLEGKKESVEMAYNSIKKVLPESNPSLGQIHRLLTGSPQRT